MDPSLDDSLNLEGMDFDHSVDVVNQADIPLEDSGRLNSISMDMDDMGERSQALLQNVNDEVIVSDLIEEPFAFQEYVHSGASGSNILVDPNQLSQLSLQQDAVSNTQTLLKGSATAPSNVVTLKVAQPRTQKRLIASAPPRQVAIAPKPTKSVQYAIAPKPVALVTNKQNTGSMKKVPISSDGKGNTVLAQIGRQLVMVPKKIKLMSSTSAEGVISSSSGGLQYQVACTPEQAQNMPNKGNKPLIKFIQVPDRSSIEQATNSGLLTKVMPTNAPRARYVMQQKTVPISIGGNKFDLQNIKIAGKRQIIAIKSQSKLVQVPQGNVATKKVVISSNSSQKMVARTTAPTSTSQVTKDTISSGQRTQFHPINVPGKGIQYIKLVTNQPKSAQKPVAFPAKNFVLTDSKGNLIQMTAEKVGGQSQSVVIPTSVTAGKVVKGAKKLVRIAPVMKTITQPVSQTGRSSQSLLAPINTVTPTTTVPMTSLPVIESPGVSSKETVPIQEIDDIDEQSEKMDHSYTDEKSIQHSFNLSYLDKSKTDSNDFSIEDEYSAATEYAEDSSHLAEETVQEVIAEETVDVKPTLQSLITEAVSENKSGDSEIECLHDVEVEFEKKYDCIRNASFVLRDDNVDHNTSASDMNEETIIIVPGTNYMDKQNESMYADDSRLYHSQRHSTEERRDVPLMSVEAECLPYPEITIPLSPGLSSDQDASANLDMRPRKACNCTKSQCLKLYCDCFANGEFCNGCNCNNCHNNLENEEVRQKAIRSCLERNPNAFRPKIGKAKAGGPEIVRRHTKGCNCKRSGCLKNYCECYEAKIACTAMCKCVGCRNVEEILVRRRDTVRMRVREKLNDSSLRPATAPVGPVKQPCSFMTTEVIEAVCQCLIAAAGESDTQRGELDPVQDVIEEFARCLQDVITASHHTL